MWDVPGAKVVLPFLSSDPLKDSTDWLEEQAAGLPRQDFDREYLVDFSVFTGKPVYPEYRDHLHRSPTPIPYVPNRVIIRGWDIPGPLACCWMQVAPVDQKMSGNVYAGGTVRLNILAELYCDVGVAEFGRQVQQLSKDAFPGAGSFVDWSDPQAWAHLGNDKRSAAAELKSELGIILNPGPADNTARQIGVRRWLTRIVPTNRASEPAGGMLVDPSCVMIRDGFRSGYHYREIEKTGRFMEIPTKNEFSHIMNALEYGASRAEDAEISGAHKHKKIAVPVDAILGRF